LFVSASGTIAAFPFAEKARETKRQALLDELIASNRVQGLQVQRIGLQGMIHYQKRKSFTIGKKRKGSPGTSHNP
jgi:hypothetical protein